jgi:hypothetical protein
MGANVIGLHSIISTYVRGGVEGKRITLTQGERVLEVAMPRDKQLNSIDDKNLAHMMSY